MLYDRSLDEHIEESRNFNGLARAVFEALDVDYADPAILEHLRNLPPMPGQEPLEDTEVIAIPGPASDVPARVRRPTGAPTGVYLDIHGGGWALGRAESTDQTNAALVENLGIATVSIDYRLAPEHPFPAGPDDCEAAALWLNEHAQSEFGSDRLLIGGGSAGAHLAALTLLRLRDRHDLAHRFVGANLVFGAFDLGMTPSQRTSDDAIGIPRPILEVLYTSFLPGLDEEARRDPSISPLYADLSNLPPALFTVGTLDPLLDDSLFMAARWTAAGNRAELAVYPESIHGFVAFPTALGSHARERINGFLRSCLD